MSEPCECYHFNPYNPHNVRTPATLPRIKAATQPEYTLPACGNSGLSDSDDSESDTTSTKDTASTDAATPPPVLPYNSQTVEPIPALFLESFTKLFVGQVARSLTPEQVAHLLTEMTGRRAAYVERIVKWTNHGRPCGCFHVWVHPGDTEAFLQANRTALCVAEGFMVARTAAEHCFLEDTVALMAARQGERRGVPSQLVTVACATSQYSQAARAVVHEPGHGPFPPPPHRRSPRNAGWGYPAMPYPVGQ